MSSLSKFQTLPLLIVDSIAHHLVNGIGCTRPSFPPIEILEPSVLAAEAALEKAIAEQWKIIYNVSRYWRELALGHFCKKATIRLDAETLDHLKVTFDDWPPELGEVNVDKNYYYVKNVVFRFGKIADELSKTFAVFADSWYDTAAFPNATKITVLVDRIIVRDHHWFSSLSETNRMALQRITGNVLKALPKFAIASIEMGGSRGVYTQYVTREMFAEHGLQKLLPSVSAGSATQDTNIESPIYIKEYPYLVSEASLTRLYYNYSHPSERAVPVIVRNSPVLVTLVLERLKLPLLKTIVLDKENNPIVYPRLKNFEYLSGGYLILGEGIKMVRGISFPALERVKCQQRYIFKDDALFRGCAETLKHLDMQVDVDAANILIEHGVVEKLRNLRSINFKFGNQPLTLQDGKVFALQLAFGLVSRSTRSLKMCDFVDDYSIAETIVQYPNIQNLVNLNLGTVKLQLIEVMEMIQILPNVEYFGYACGGLKLALGHVELKDMPSLVLKKYYPLSLRLKYCEINVSQYASIRFLAITAMLLALLCPRFTFAKVPDKVLAAYNRIIENAICDEPYLEYSDRLQCLLR